jgi:hypothetical protein
MGRATSRHAAEPTTCVADATEFPEAPNFNENNMLQG